MSTAQIPIELQPLLQPISTSAPAGESLRYEGTYDRIQEARREEMDLPQGVWQRDPKRADWSTVEQLCTQALMHRTKDLQIAIWLTEAWVHLGGAAGLTHGMQLIRGLHELFWQTMYPAVEDLEYRTSQLAWLNEKLPMALKFITIAHPVDTTMLPIVSFARLETAQHADYTTRRQPQQGRGSDAAKPELPLLQRSMASTPDGFYRDLDKELREAMQTCRDSDTLFDTLYGPQNPGLRQLQEVLASIASTVEPLVKAENIVVQAEAMVSVEEAQTAMSEETVSAPAAAGPVRNRRDAYRTLSEIADFLARTEPHSPVPYLLRRAIAWGNMDLGQLLPELLNNENALKDVAGLLQIDSPRK